MNKLPIIVFFKYQHVCVSGNFTIAFERSIVHVTYHTDLFQRNPSGLNVTIILSEYILYYKIVNHNYPVH